MPTIPNSVGFTPRPYQNANAVPAAFGDGGRGLIEGGKALQQAAGMVSALAQKESQERDEDAIRAADVAFSDWQRTNRLAKDGFYQKQGLDAESAFGSYETSLKERAASVRDGLPSEDAQRAWDRLSSHRIEGELSRAAAHVENQRDAYTSQQFAARQGLLARDAAEAWSDPALMAQNLAALRSDYADQATRKGWSQDVLNLTLQKAESEVYATAITAAMAQNPAAARALFEQHGSRLDIATRASLGTQTQRAASEALGVRLGDAAYSSLSAPVFEAGSYGERLSVAEGTGKNVRSSAIGVGQFVAGTWLDMVRTHRPAWVEGKSDEEVLALRQDPELAGQMVEVYRQENAKTLTAAGLPVTDGTLYLAHFLGPGDAKRVLSAPPNAPVLDLVQSASLAANPEVFGIAKTAGALVGWAEHRIQPSGADKLSSAYRQLEDIADPHARDIAERKFETHLQQQAKVSKARTEEAQKALFQAVQAGGSVDDVPLPLRMAAGIEAEKSARSYQEQRGKIPRNDALYGSLLKQMEDPEAFAQVNLYGFVTRLPKEDWNYLHERQKEIKAEAGKPSDYGFAEKVVSQMAPIQGWKSNGTKADYRPEDLATLNRMARQAVDLARAEGRTVTEKDITRVVAAGLLDLRGDSFGATAYSRSGSLAAVYASPLEDPQKQISLASQAIGMNPELVALTIDHIRSQDHWYSRSEPITLDAIAKAAPAVAAHHTGRSEPLIRAILSSAGDSQGITLDDLASISAPNAPQSRPWGN